MSPAPKALTCSGRSEINVTRKSMFEAVRAMRECCAALGVPGLSHLKYCTVFVS